MFGLFASQEKKTRTNARHWLELADKVWHFRRDQLTPAEGKELLARTESLRQTVKAKADAAKLKLGIEALEPVLRRVGGKIYPKSALIENVEFFVVAAIVVLGFRAYFIQPFKIPTNSMWPTYYGMTAENLPPGSDVPGPVARAFRFLAFGAQRVEADAPATGGVTADFFESGGVARVLAYKVVNGRSWLVLPAQLKEYTFYVNGEPTSVRVPLDFHDVDRVVQETYFGGADKFAAYATQQARSGQAERGVAKISEQAGYARVVRLPLSPRVEAGSPVVRFDLMTGDQLFVDRFSYNFVRPTVGQGFVFRTGHIPGIANQFGDQYYIKRLAGVPGDVIAIKDFTLYRNGAPATGAAAFAKNARRVEKYPGYRAEGSLANGGTMTVPADGFLALGDNSANSEDGRFWGFVPAKDAVGRPLFIYYPFTKRWGPAK